ncbi:MAG TPA: TSUP family transporter [Ignavibacteriales bacterium]|nr:TSUP family transporter [Ignavibacteriales bacterium]HOL82065.1 TSUP family transporter [Ignavibacteriales bacterium]HOM66130.1 TSUP family transporter [Ignavibacteriales bacterium]HPD66464.1 TSUP family transporter [Ignavibacteriales bacterium]HPP34199.1 TSUP family transporter [Ignavibacteriales bacterium]
MEIILISIFAFIAGFIDSIIGGGGLIQIPALMVLFPTIPLPTLFGVNKFSSISGTTMAIINYTYNVKYPKRYLIKGAVTAFIFSAIGAFLVTIISPGFLRPFVIFLLIFVLVYTLIKKDFGKIKQKHFEKNIIALLIFSSIIGFYDGFFGPGTGSFLIFCFIYFMNLNFLQASASAKIINFSTNLSALLYFILSGHFILHLAIIMAIFNILGAYVGTKSAIKFGTKYIRILFILIVSILIIKLILDQIKLSF